MALNMIAWAGLAFATIGDTQSELGAGCSIKAPGQTAQLSAYMEHDVRGFIATRGQTQTAVIVALVEWPHQI